jgi:hypothetical protein
MITFILVALAAANSICLFTRFRSYDMQLRSAQEPVPSPHASPVPAPQQSDDPFSAPQQQANDQTTRKAWRLLVLVVRWTLYVSLHLPLLSHSVTVMSALGKPVAPPSSNTDEIQSLRVWDPPEFSLNFFWQVIPPDPR